MDVDPEKYPNYARWRKTEHNDYESMTPEEKEERDQYIIDSAIAYRRHIEEKREQQAQEPSLESESESELHKKRTGFSDPRVRCGVIVLAFLVLLSWSVVAFPNTPWFINAIGILMTAGIIIGTYFLVKYIKGDAPSFYSTDSFDDGEDDGFPGPAIVYNVFMK